MAEKKKKKKSFKERLSDFFGKKPGGKKIIRRTTGQSEGFTRPPMTDRERRLKEALDRGERNNAGLYGSRKRKKKKK